ncbi:MAG: hypothetical protein WCI87_09340, partial [Euryarchaeota archaeon]
AFVYVEYPVMFWGAVDAEGLALPLEGLVLKVQPAVATATVTTIANNPKKHFFIHNIAPASINPENR